MKPLLTKEEIAELLSPLGSETRTGQAEQAVDTDADKHLQVRVEFDGSRVSLRKLMELKEGSIVHIDAPAAEQLHLYIGNQLFAEGELVHDGSKIGVKITKVFAVPESPGTPQL